MQFRLPSISKLLFVWNLIEVFSWTWWAIGKSSSLMPAAPPRWSRIARSLPGSPRGSPGTPPPCTLPQSCGSGFWWGRLTGLGVDRQFDRPLTRPTWCPRRLQWSNSIREALGVVTRQTIARPSTIIQPCLANSMNINLLVCRKESSLFSETRVPMYFLRFQRKKFNLRERMIAVRLEPVGAPVRAVVIIPV